MSCTFDLKHMLIFTGGVDGTLIGWNSETWFPRYQMHRWDDTCTSENFIAESKSVDSLVIFEERRVLLSMSADQWLRFWDLEDLNTQTYDPTGPIWKMHAGHSISVGGSI